MSTPLSALGGLVRRTGTYSPTSKVNQREEAIIKQGTPLTPAQENTIRQQSNAFTTESVLRFSYAKETGKYIHSEEFPQKDMLHPNKKGNEFKKPVLRVHEKIQGKLKLFQEEKKP